jgi:hypothetical protein
VSGVRGQIRVSADRRRHGVRGTAPDRGEDPISHAHARTLAALWQDPDRPDFALTVLARTGAIASGADLQLQHDLAALSRAAHLSSDPGTTICQAQIEALLTYVRVHGRRGPVAGWTALPDDGEFVEATQEFARARRPHLSDTPAALPLTLTTQPPTERPVTHHASPAERPSASHPRRIEAAVLSPPDVPAVHDDVGDDPQVAVLSHLRSTLTDRGTDPLVIDRVVSAVRELVDAVAGATKDHRDKVPARTGDAGT